MDNNVLNICCPTCGAPAQFDIIHQIYACQYCGGKVTVKDAKKEKSKLIRWYRQNPNEKYMLETTTCPGCGAKIVFEEDEALTHCEFCGGNLVRKRYGGQSELPQYVIPFGVTLEEAKEKLSEWCSKNPNKREAKHLSEKISELRGYYLPYEMVRGPVHCAVSKRSEAGTYEADGYLNDEFINCSAQLDNMVLDAMEPFDLDNLQEFDFAFVAGHRVKITDMNEKAVTERLHDEAEANYRARFEKIWGTRSIAVDTTVQEVIRFPVLLPVYYISDGKVKAAVNGQTGKVSVCAEKESSYLSIPWWLKGISVLLLVLGATFGACCGGGYDIWESLYFTGTLGIVYFVIFICIAFSGGSTEFGIFHYRNIFNSGDAAYHREKGRLVPNENVLKRRIADPVFKKKLGRKEVQVTYTFYSRKRMAFMITVSLAAIFLPVILALIINGFDFTGLSISGSAVWFLITLPTVPIIFVHYGIQRLYEDPLVYLVEEDGSRKRYGKKIDRKKFMEEMKFWLKLLFIPPGGLITCFIIAIFIASVYFTVFGG